MVYTFSAETKTTEGLSGAKFKTVDRPKTDDDPPTKEKSIPVEGNNTHMETVFHIVSTSFFLDHK